MATAAEHITQILYDRANGLEEVVGETHSLEKFAADEWVQATVHDIMVVVHAVHATEGG